MGFVHRLPNCTFQDVCFIFQNELMHRIRYVQFGKLKIGLLQTMWIYFNGQKVSLKQPDFLRVSKSMQTCLYFEGSTQINDKPPWPSGHFSTGSNLMLHH